MKLDKFRQCVLTEQKSSYLADAHIYKDEGSSSGLQTGDLTMTHISVFSAKQAFIDIAAVS